ATLVLEGRIVLYGPGGEREVPADEFFLGPGATAMQPGELMTAVRFPIPPANAVGRYLKLGRNKAGDLAIAGVAVFGFPNGTTPSGYHFRIGLASVAPVPLRAWEAEEVLATSPPGEETFTLAAEKAMEAATPIDDVRASAAYRKAMVRALTLRGLWEVWAQMKEGK
ncbi:MAG: xanthine dehydrogenase family protein subunit M, partial [Chloroflexi bacterium]|nr:xanthine dehydrogenase family protein subunit M [Chloroflexota bacterium]